LQQKSEALYEKGDFIGQKYEVKRELGRGGMGVVYLVYSHETKEVYALKTFKGEFLEDAEEKKMFLREANVWIDLGRHPNLVQAYFVEELEDRFYIGMEYIAPNEMGLNSLQSYLERQPPDLAQSLRWAIQFCYGMEYAYWKGVRCHRDIKPANIMISTDKSVKITDFGIAGVLGSTMVDKGIGTPTHMPPEQFTNAAACDERSDVYAFGVVLYQMATGGSLPFWADASRDSFLREMYLLHSQAQVSRLDSPLFPIVQRCLEKSPERRYQTFEELRDDLELLLKHQTGEIVKLPVFKDLEIWELSNKGVSLNNLGRSAEALECYDKALKINPQIAEIWSNKGDSLRRLGRFDDAIKCCDKALEINPQYAAAWSNKGLNLARLGRFDDAIKCYDRALEITPQIAEAWNGKGISLRNLGRFDEALECYDKALEINPQIAEIWSNKGVSLRVLGRYDKALKCCDKALEINPQLADAWLNKGNIRYSLKRFAEAIKCYDKALEINPRDAEAWSNRGANLRNLSRYNEALECYDKALEINPQYAESWYNKGATLERLRRRRDAAACYRKFIEVAPAQFAGTVKNIRQRLQRLERS
jgi:tetratricopeptide (TPR) repeat protein